MSNLMKTFEQTLKELEDYKFALDETSIVAITDRRGMITYVNEKFCEISGYSREELAGKDHRLINSGYHPKEFFRIMWQEIGSGQVWRGEIKNKAKDGSLYWVDTVIVPFMSAQWGEGSGDPYQYVSIRRDITKRKATEEKLENIRQEVLHAGEIQRNMQPQALENGEISITTIFSPSSYVSGDMIEFKWSPDTHMLIGCVMDIMGHGLATALQTSALRVLFHQATCMSNLLREKLLWISENANGVLMEDTFAACILFELDVAKGRASYVSGGINHFHFWSDLEQKVLLHKVPGAFIGLSNEEYFESGTVHFEAGDGFIFSSDGLLDEMSVDFMNRDWSYDRFNRFLREMAYTPGRRDDVSAICIRIKGGRDVHDSGNQSI